MSIQNLCRPGYGASCALCCGSHNYDATFEEIQTLYRMRRDTFQWYSPEYLAKRLRESRSNLTGSYYPHRTIDKNLIITLPKLYADGIQCPFVCLLNDGTIGCALYPEKPDNDARFDCFQNYTCKYFSCQSKEILVDAEIEYAARLFGDWYYYTLFVHSIGMLRAFMARNPNPEQISQVDIAQLKRELIKQLHVENHLHAIHSYFA